MKRYKETHRDNLNTHMAIYDHGKPIVHPTLFEYQIFETHQQIDILLTQLDIVANQRADSDCYKDEQRSKETSITMNISLIYEDLSHLYESSGKPKDALESIVTASQSLFFPHWRQKAAQPPPHTLRRIYFQARKYLNFQKLRRTEN